MQTEHNMHSSLVTLAFGLALAGLSSATPDCDVGLYEFLSKRTTITPDGTCGNVAGGSNNGYTCNTGDCCSQYGYCGNETSYCTSGCQSAFGTCTDTSSSSELCGPNNGNAICSNNQCCSQSGYCGTTSDFCADPGSCLYGFGRCDSDTTPAGPSTANVPRPFLGSVSYTDDIFDCVQPGVVALTYDDGPYIYTAQLLDTLKSYGFQATFFITGNNNGKGQIDIAAPYPDLIRRMINEGHQVASHTWSHYSLSNISSALRISQMVKNEMAFNNIIGKWPTYMRPPYSQCSQQSGCWTDMQALGYHRVYFDLDTQDYLNPLASQVQNSKDIVKAYMANSAAAEYLAIQHDIGEQSATNLTSYFFDLIKNKGWKGVTAGDCLGDTDRSNWYRTFDNSTSSSLIASSTSTTTSTSILLSASPTLLSSALASSALPSSSLASSALPSSALNNSVLNGSALMSKISSISTSTISSSTSKLSSISTSSTLVSISKKSSSSTSISSSKKTSIQSTWKSSVAPSSTKKTSTSSTKPTTAKPASTPTQSCLSTNSNWCKNVSTFTSFTGCHKAVADCNNNLLKCYSNSVLSSSHCVTWATVCMDLLKYCQKCLLQSCSNIDALSLLKEKIGPSRRD